MALPYTNKIKGLIPLKDYILVTDMSFDQRTLSSGIIMLGDDKKTDGIRPRWAKVYAVGPEQTDVVVGQYVLVEHGRWTRGSSIEVDGEQLTIRRIDGNAIMLVSDEAPPADDNISTAVDAQQLTRTQYD